MIFKINETKKSVSLTKNSVVTSVSKVLSEATISFLLRNKWAVLLQARRRNSSGGEGGLETNDQLCFALHSS